MRVSYSSRVPTEVRHQSQTPNPPPSPLCSSTSTKHANAPTGIGLAIVHTLLARHPKDQIFVGVRSLASIPPELLATPTIHPLELDVTSDASIAVAVQTIAAAGPLDVLINNAGVATLPARTHTPADTREIWARTLDTNVASVAALTTACAPLLVRAAPALVINISSGRGSMTRNAAGDMPPTQAVPYSVSKAALNMLTLELGKNLKAQGVGVVAVNPGFCATDFNNYRGTRDVMDGAKCIVDVLDSGATEGFWEAKQDGGPLSRALW